MALMWPASMCFSVTKFQTRRKVCKKVPALCPVFRCCICVRRSRARTQVQWNPARIGFWFAPPPPARTRERAFVSISLTRLRNLWTYKQRKLSLILQCGMSFCTISYYSKHLSLPLNFSFILNPNLSCDIPNRRYHGGENEYVIVCII